MDDQKQQQKQVAELAAEHGLADNDMIVVYQRACAALSKEFGATIFSGVGMGAADIGVEFNGAQFRFDITLHKPKTTVQ